MYGPQRPAEGFAVYAPALHQRRPQRLALQPERRDASGDDDLVPDVQPTRAPDTALRLSATGGRLASDDFGTGYSPLAHLKRLPVSELKIDRSFVRDMASNDEDATIVRSTIGMAHDLGLSVVAEGVETESTLWLLKKLGCDVAQGYHISRPLPANEFAAWVRARFGPGLELERAA